MTAQSRTRLRKELGLFDVYAISTGAMFSSGLFLLPGLAAAQTGPSVPLAYLVAALFIVPPMLCVAELATAMPRAGGAYYFLDRSLGPWIGTVGGLGTWVALVLKSAFALVGLGAYLSIYVDLPIQPVAVVLTLVFAVVNIVGAKETSGLQRVLVVTLLAVLGLFLVAGLTEVVGSGGSIGDSAGDPYLAFGVGGFLSTVGFVFVSYAGLTKVASVSEEVINPDRNIPLGMIMSLATAAVVYTVGVFIVVAVMPMPELRADLTPVASAARYIPGLSGSAGLALIVVAALAAFASTGNAGVLSASRYPLAMARDKLVPSGFATLGRFRTPTAAIVATAALMVLAILLLPIEEIAKLASAFQLLLFSLLSLAVVIMRESGIRGYDPGYRSPLYPWLHIVGFLAPVWLIAQMGGLALLFTFGLVAVTTGWYLRYGSPRVRRAGAIFHTFARLGERRTTSLDDELRYIVKEKGLREEDPFREIVARAEAIDLKRRIDFEDLIDAASERLEKVTGTSADRLGKGFQHEFDSGFMPIDHGVAIPHLRLEGLERPTMLLARCRDGVQGEWPSEHLDPDRLADVRAVLFLVSPEGEHGPHLRLIGHLASLAEEETFLQRWEEARDEAELRAALIEEEHVLTLEATPGRPAAAWIGRALRELELPAGTLVAVIHRGFHTIIPQGDTVIHLEDRITVIGEPGGIRQLERILGMEAAPDGTDATVGEP